MHAVSASIREVNEQHTLSNNMENDEFPNRKRPAAKVATSQRSVAEMLDDVVKVAARSPVFCDVERDHLHVRDSSPDNRLQSAAPPSSTIVGGSRLDYCNVVQWPAGGSRRSAEGDVVSCASLLSEISNHRLGTGSDARPITNRAFTSFLVDDILSSEQTAATTSPNDGRVPQLARPHHPLLPLTPAWCFAGAICNSDGRVSLQATNEVVTDVVFEHISDTSEKRAYKDEWAAMKRTCSDNNGKVKLYSIQTKHTLVCIQYTHFFHYAVDSAWRCAPSTVYLLFFIFGAFIFFCPSMNVNSAICNR